MPIESATHISDLVATNPVGDTDTKATLDDHIRLIKTVLKTDFANITGAVTATHTELNAVTSKAGLASPAFTGTPTAPTAAAGTSTTQIATTAFVAGTAFSSVLPAQTGNSGKFITTDGTTASWASIVGIPQTAQVYSGPPTGTFARAASKTGTYTQAGSTTVNATVVAHGLAVGDRIYLDFTSGTGVDGWTTVVTAPTADTFTCVRTSLTTSGNVTLHMPIVVTITSQAAHGLSTSGTAYVDFSATYTDAVFTVYQATASTFQVESGTIAAGSGTVSLPSVAYTSTWTKPAGLVAVKATVVGGGGQGGLVAGSWGVGGSAGGVAVKIIPAASLGATEAVTAGYGGSTTAPSASTLAGQNGGTSSFGAHCSATGGLGGPSGVFAGNTATGVGGDYNLPGMNAAVGLSAGSAGASGLFGSGGFTVSVDATGGSATGYGAGGASANTSAPALRGGLGSSGVVIIEELF